MEAEPRGPDCVRGAGRRLRLPWQELGRAGRFWKERSGWAIVGALSWRGARAAAALCALRGTCYVGTVTCDIGHRRSKSLWA